MGPIGWESRQLHNTYSYSYRKLTKPVDISMLKNIVKNLKRKL